MRITVLTLFALGHLFLGLMSLSAQLSLRSPDHQTQEARREALKAEDRQEHDDYQAAARYWYESRNPKHLDDMEEALKRVLPGALRQSDWVTEVPSWEVAHHCQAYHAAGAILLARCYTQMYFGREAEAKESVRLINEKFPHALLLHINRTAVPVRRTLRYHMHACALYRAIRERKMYDFAFPPEMDEHDAWAQERAAEDMAMLRLREGDYDSLDHLASQARLRQIKTADGEWMTDAIYSGMHPIENERWSAAAWDEMAGRIRDWREKKPTSSDARIGEVIFMLYRFKKLEEEAGSTAALLSQLKRMIKEIGPICPQIPCVEMILSMVGKSKLETTAGIFTQAQEKFPDYMPSHMLMMMRLSAEEKGLSLCSAMLNELATSECPELPAMMLAQLPEKIVKTLAEGVSIKKLRESLNATLESCSGSLAMRNRLGLLAVRLGQDDIARASMSQVGGRWERDLWKGQEYEATRLTEQRITARPRAGKVTQL